MTAVWTPGRGSRREALDLARRLVAAIDWSDPLVLSATATAGFSLLFLLLPGIDLAVSGLFHTPQDGFWANQSPVLKALRKSSSWVLGGLLLFAVGKLIARTMARRSMLSATARRLWFLLAGLAIGPGLTVNTVLKGTWGRPRPVQLDLFGGNAPFVPAWWMSDRCQSNCSFVSGEASSAARMAAAVWVLAPVSWRPCAVSTALIYAFLLSMNRLAFGGHFLSDIVLSWALTGLVLAGLYRAMVTVPVLARPRLRARGPAMVRVRG
jgi:membrane-associated PAP2 superfamily phosphatase